MKVAVEKFSKKPESQECALSFNDLGLSYYESGKWEPALEQFNKAVELRPENAVFYNNRGLAFTHLDEYSQAMSDFNKAINLRPDDPRAYFNRGDVYCSMG